MKHEYQNCIIATAIVLTVGDVSVTLNMPAVSDAIYSLFNYGDKVAAIKLFREVYQVELYEAKYMCEAIFSHVSAGRTL